MNFTFTPSAARQILALLAQKPGDLALRIEVRRAVTGKRWAMTFEAGALATDVVAGVPIIVDATTRKLIEGMVVDWVHTAAGDGFSVYEQNLHSLNTLTH